MSQVSMGATESESSLMSESRVAVGSESGGLRGQSWGHKGHGV